MPVNLKLRNAGYFIEMSAIFFTSAQNESAFYSNCADKCYHHSANKLSEYNKHSFSIPIKPEVVNNEKFIENFK